MVKYRVRRHDGKKITFDEIGDGFGLLPPRATNSGVIIGDDSVMVVEVQATPRLANKVIEKARDDRQADHAFGAHHYHAVRVLGASAYGADQIIMSDMAAGMVEERGQEDCDKEFQRSPALKGMKAFGA